jgi:hypothetical protein
MEASRQRLAGYQAALQQAGLACDDSLVRQTNWQFSESFTATTSLLELAERPDAIFCASDWLAIGCYQALAVNGMASRRICCWRATTTRRSPSSSPAADQYPAALQRAGTPGGGVPVQSGRCRHARDAGGQAQGADIEPRLVADQPSGTRLAAGVARNLRLLTIRARRTASIGNEMS